MLLGQDLMMVNSDDAAEIMLEVLACAPVNDRVIEVMEVVKADTLDDERRKARGKTSDDERRKARDKNVTIDITSTKVCSMSYSALCVLFY
jgi:hypothetical protein